ncbi:zinc-dependent metalloprotease [Planctomicrobium sp. SH664]|uniref:zinc-dependent metalloprotease n=1 Tax=Planctomicrobium sp. SH664 TaxID=3448125 RepID=UPI003F5B5458
MARRCACILFLLFAAGNLYAQAPAASTEAAKSKFDQLTDKKKKVEGMWTLYHTDQQLLVELSPSALAKDYIVIPSISKGISRGLVLGGMSWGFGEDVIWGFKKTEEKLFVLQRNVRFRAKAGTPEASAVQLAYSDSILYSLPILAKSPSGGILVDMTSIFMSDDQEIGSSIGPGFRFASDRSTIATLKGFQENVELQINAVYSGSFPIDTVPSSRGVQVGVHYSISVLPPVGANGYKPRVADNRVGYFVTAIKDFSDKDDPDHFVRYINRWNLKKKDDSADLSPPEAPIKFYMENTVPVYLRPTVAAGILEWNKAFEKLGIWGAIQVQQQEADPNFDPENIHYNTFRWMTAEARFAMGPSRIDLRTGQILDADIIFDASFLDSWSRRWETFRGLDDPKKRVAMSPEEALGLLREDLHAHTCTYCQDMHHQRGFAAATFMAIGATPDGNLPKDFIHEGLKEVVMHEVGHTLGLRHNFKASTWKSLSDINNPETGRKEGIVASVMDYNPPNISLDREKQGLYYTQTIGPYDYWAIEYGYKPISGNEKEELKKIAARSSEPALAYSTDEDTRFVDPDPLSNRFDLGNDPLEFVRRQMEQSTQLLPKVVDKAVKPGEGYERARQAFVLLFEEYWRAANLAARYPGGILLSRQHKTAENPKAPFEIVPAEKQREAMKLLASSAFAPPTINGPDLNYLGISRWNHWGTSDPLRLDYPIHDNMLMAQEGILNKLLSSYVLTRILDSEFKSPADKDAYTLAEHMQLLTDSVFAEWKQAPGDRKIDNRNPLITSFRRNLQRSAIQRLGQLLTQGYGAPSDARTLTRMHLQQLRDAADKLLKTENITLDDYTRAHLQDSVARIDIALKPELIVPSVN